MLSHVMKHEEDTRKQGQKIVTEVLPFIRAMQSPVDRAHFIKVISSKSGIPENTLIEETSRGVFAQSQTQKENEVVALPSKDRLTREIIAYATLYGKLKDQKIRELSIDVEQFPEGIIQEEMFKIEERVIGDKDKYFDDLLKTYRREKHKEELVALQQKYRIDGADHDAIMKEIHDHMKRGY
jgi:hypothetical protein